MFGAVPLGPALLELLAPPPPLPACSFSIRRRIIMSARRFCERFCSSSFWRIFEQNGTCKTIACIEAAFKRSHLAYRAIGLIAIARVVAAECDELLADRACCRHSPLADFGVLHNALHLLACWPAAVCVATLAGMNERLYALFDRLVARVMRFVRLCTLNKIPNLQTR